MVNIFDAMHGACTVFLIDEISSLAMMVLAKHEGREHWQSSSDVSQTIDTVYHAPAPLGTKLRVIGTCDSLDETSPLVCRAEILGRRQSTHRSHWHAHQVAALTAGNPSLMMQPVFACL